MKIHAMAALEPSEKLVKWEYDFPEIGPHDCLVKIKACGICHSDLHMIDNDWGVARYPLVPGHEAVGEVIETGSAVDHLRLGDRVGIGWQRSADLTCEDCLSGHDNLCRNSQGVITHGYGGFADHIHMDSRFCFKLPDGVSTEVAGPLLCGGATVYSALRGAGMGSGMRIGVIGVGGLGHMAVLFASKLGNEVTVFTTSPDKAEFAAKLGATNAVVTEQGAPPRTKERFDILLNTVPFQLDWNAYLKLLRPHGTLSFVGVPGGESSLDIGLLLAKERRVTASVIGSRAMITDMLRVADRYEVNPIVETFPLAEANTALEKVRDNTIRYRAVLTV